MKKLLVLLFSALVISLFLCSAIMAQIDSSLLRRIPVDSSQASRLSMDAIYNRPFLQAGNSRTSLGGYLDFNYQNESSDGVNLGKEFQFRRMSIFLSSSLARHIKFLTEIEFENDKDEQLEGEGMEINIEYAALDFIINPLLNIRSGIILNPIGAFNQNHDGPRWDFTDRPLAMTQMLPGVWSSSGVGIYGKKNEKSWLLGYELYLTNGLSNAIIDNDQGRTYLPQAMHTSARMVTNLSGSPMFTGKLSMSHQSLGELGLSMASGVYNQQEADGLMIEESRSCRIYDVDFNFQLPKINTKISSEWAWVQVELPANYFEQFGNRQFGGYMDIIQPIYKYILPSNENLQLNLALRTEYIDYNRGEFRELGTPIGDEVKSIMPGISLRYAQQSVLRFSYRRMWSTDVMGNPPSITSSFQVGISSYF